MIRRAYSYSKLSYYSYKLSICKTLNLSLKARYDIDFEYLIRRIKLIYLNFYSPAPFAFAHEYNNQSEDIIFY